MILNSYQAIVWIAANNEKLLRDILCASSGLAGQFLSDPETSVLKERFCVP